MTSPHKTIGLVGGLGPWAALDVHRRVLANTPAQRDQDHRALVHLARPGAIADRTAFLLGESELNPGEAIAQVVRDLLRVGAQVIGLPCITAHAPAILAPTLAVIEQWPEPVVRVDLRALLEGELAAARAAGVRRLALLCTLGSRRAQVLDSLERPPELELYAPPPELQTRVQGLIQSIKVSGSPTWESAGRERQRIVDAMVALGCDGVMLGCTELPLPSAPLVGVHTIDPNELLARALVRASA